MSKGRMKGASVAYIAPCTLDYAPLNPTMQKGRVQVSYMTPVAPFLPCHAKGDFYG